MKFLVTWSITADKRKATREAFAAMSEADHESQFGPGITLLGRWHDLAQGSGAAVFETEDLAQLHQIAMKWNPALDFNVSAVLDDQEAVEAIRAQAEEMVGA